MYIYIKPAAVIIVKTIRQTVILCLTRIYIYKYILIKLYQIGAADGSRTHVPGLEGEYNSRYTTAANLFM